MHARFGSGVVGLAGLAFFTVHRRNIDDAAKALFDHIANHLLGDVEHGVQVSLNHAVPVVARHLHEHAVFGDAGVVDQHVDGAVLGLGLGKRFNGGIPGANVAYRGVKGVAQSGLLSDPLGVVTGRAATGDDLKTLFVQTLANGSPDTTHATGHVSYFLTHELLLLIDLDRLKYY